MLVFCHLFVGAAIGLVFARATGDRRLILAGLVAGILPDLIDKPLGHLVLVSTLDNGRLIAHSLAFLLVLLIAGSVLLRGRRPLLALVIALGVLSHQLLDAMWRDPVAWYFPLLGPFVPGHYPDYFLSGLVAELGSPSEWLFGAATVALVLAVFRPTFVPAGVGRLAGRLLPAIAVLLGVAGAVAVAMGAVGLSSPLGPGLAPGDVVLLGFAALGGALVIGDERYRPGGERLQQPG